MISDQNYRSRYFSTMAKIWDEPQKTTRISKTDLFGGVGTTRSDSSVCSSDNMSCWKNCGSKWKQMTFGPEYQNFVFKFTFSALVINGFNTIEVALQKVQLLAKKRPCMLQIINVAKYLPERNLNFLGHLPLIKGSGVSPAIKLFWQKTQVFYGPKHCCKLFFVCFQNGKWKGLFTFFADFEL